MISIGPREQPVLERRAQLISSVRQNTRAMDVLRTVLSADCLALAAAAIPGSRGSGENGGDARGVPDAWIYDEDGRCVVVESKVVAPLRTTQLERHRRPAEASDLK